MKQLLKNVLGVFNPYFVILLLWIAAESLFINAQLAYRKNHPKAEKLARWGGYVAAALALATFGKSILGI
mgnify:CR=1 FL=1